MSHHRARFVAATLLLLAAISVPLAQEASE